MKVVYIASPYTIGDVAQNVAVQQEYAHKIMDLGHCPIAPLLSHYLHLYKQRPWEDWMNCDLEIVRRVDIVLRLPGESRGADIETNEAQYRGIPVAFGWNKLMEMLKGG